MIEGTALGEYRFSFGCKGMWCRVHDIRQSRFLFTEIVWEVGLCGWSKKASLLRWGVFIFIKYCFEPRGLIGYDPIFAWSESYLIISISPTSDTGVYFLLDIQIRKMAIWG